MIIENESQHSVGLNVIGEKTDPLAMQIGRGQAGRGKKPFMYCEYCNMKGHTKENCYKLIGYPPDFKAKRNFKPGYEGNGGQGSYG